MKKGIVEYLKNHAELKPVWMHMPGHKGSAFFRKYGYGDFLDMIVDGDITEITGADNKFSADGIIKETMDKYKELYDVRKSYLLINGTSGGIIASVLTSVHKGKKLIMSRNCHKSVFSALRLAGAESIYAYPELAEGCNILGEVKADEIKRLLYENPDAEAVILPSPNYYGVCSDIEAIAQVVHEAGKILIVDQAHGAHLKFFSKYGIEGMPKSAEEQGADITINSTHKTLATFTQSAVLNVNSDKIDLAELEENLMTIESSSPSYLLMASHDMNVHIIEEHGEKIFNEWKESLDYFYDEAAKIQGLKILRPNGLDETKLNIDMSALGFDGDMLEEELMKYNIFVELTSDNILMCMTGIGTTHEDIEKLIAALRDIAEKHAVKVEQCRADESSLYIYREKKLELFSVPQKKRLVPLNKAVGCICAVSIIPYPPGIPIVCPGECITEEVAEYIISITEAGHKVIGVTENLEIFVGV